MHLNNVPPNRNDIRGCERDVLDKAQDKLEAHGGEHDDDKECLGEGVKSENLWNNKKGTQNQLWHTYNIYISYIKLQIAPTPLY